MSHLGRRRRANHIARLVPQTMAPGHQPTTDAAWRHRPSTYVVCTEDRVMHPDLQRRFATRATRAITWRSDHGAFASHEHETVDLLHRLATASRLAPAG
ncbi:hypothetical protein [Kitasatospora purpeofusca]|uniref:Alpha/beta hydrolase family protein n=1 Tax=Kitasatospora purpeofusca TaxID=67352 RepID=A0ABZ1TXI2_9ACTN|nr:hypothetical protein [Kitasatospora purpeofusca]